MQRVESPALRLSSLVRGCGPGILLVHGVGGTAQGTFGTVLRPLAEKFTVIAPDYPGSGETPRMPGPLQLDDLADQHVAAVVDAGQDAFAVVGHSMGCAVAIRAATRHPDRVTALALTAGFARVAASTRLQAQVWLSLLGHSRDAMARYLMSLMLGERYLSRMTDEQIERFAELVGLTLPEGTADQIRLLLDFDVRADLPRIAVPAVVIGTAADMLVPPRMSRELAGGIPGARYAELDCGHQPGLESASEWLRLLREFLGAVVARGVRDE